MMLVLLMGLWSTTGVAQVDPNLQKYVGEFITDSQGKVTEHDFNGFKVIFESTGWGYGKKNPLGECSWDKNEVHIDPNYWNQASEVSRWTTMYHELGHCICMRDHVEEDWFLKKLHLWGVRTARKETVLLYDGCAKSIMFPEDFGDWCVNVHKEYYVHELFEDCKVRHETH